MTISSVRLKFQEITQSPMEPRPKSWQRDSSRVYLKINVPSEAIHEKLGFQTQVDTVWTLLPALSGNGKEGICREQSADWGMQERAESRKATKHILIQNVPSPLKFRPYLVYPGLKNTVKQFHGLIKWGQIN